MSDLSSAAFEGGCVRCTGDVVDGAVVKLSRRHADPHETRLAKVLGAAALVHPAVHGDVVGPGRPHLLAQHVATPGEATGSAEQGQVVLPAVVDKGGRGSDLQAQFLS